MSRVDLLWRLAGGVAIIAGWGTSLLHRAVLHAHIGGPPSTWEWVLGLLTFALVSSGALLLLNGARLREGGERDGQRPGAVRPKSPRL